jgi:AcrR family transcriptional regulator
MSPRRYDMKVRAASTEATRARVLEAAMWLHARHGYRETSWEAVGRAAGVSTATVYRHFPTTSDLVRACARQVFDIVRPPTLEEASEQFALMDVVGDRFAHLARESAHCYRRGEGWLHAAHRERDFVDDLDAVVTLFEDSLHVLVNAAAGRRLPGTAHATLFTLCDFPFWKSLVETGLSYRTVERSLVELVRAETVRLGLSPQEEA